MQGEEIQATASEPAGHAILDVEELVKSLTGAGDGSDDDHVRTQQWRATIYRVTPSVRRTDSSAYDPKVVSIGPFHRDNEDLRPMQEVKRRYLLDLLARSESSEVNLRRSIEAVNGRVKEIRGQYSEEFGDIADEKFVEMMVLDGCFILELMIKMAPVPMDYNIFVSLPGGKWILQYVLYDLMLVENQIPYFVLEILFNTMKLATSHYSRVVELVFYSKFFYERLPEEKMPNWEFFHLLHVYQYCHPFYLDHDERPPAVLGPSSSIWRAAYRKLPRIRRVSDAVSQVCFRLFYVFVSCLVCSCARGRRLSTSRYGMVIPSITKLQEVGISRYGMVIPSITKLQEAGIKFKRKQDLERRPSIGPDPRSVSFSKDEGVFEIPFVILDQWFNWRLRNLVAFEQCLGVLTREEHRYFTAYCILMSLLIDTERDVDVLVEHGIINNLALRPGEVAALFDNACTGVPYKLVSFVGAYGELMRDVIEFLQDDVHRWRAKLMRDYFDSPWAVVSLVAAVVLLVLAALQTFYTVYAYYHARSSSP